MLTETVDRIDADGTGQQPTSIGLIEAFLNPLAFAASGTDAGRGGRRHRARHDPPGRQRDRRVRHRGAAQQPARPAARPRHHQPGPRPRHRRPVAERGAARVLRRHRRRQPAEALRELGGVRAGDLKHPASLVNFIAAYGTHQTIARRDRRSRTSAPRRSALVHAAAIDAPADRARLPERHRRLGERAERRDHHRPRRRRPLDRRPRREADAVRRPARLDLQLRLRDADGGAAGRRPLLLPGPHRRPQLLHRARAGLLRRPGDAQHRREAPAVRRLLDPDPHHRAERPEHLAGGRGDRRSTGGIRFTGATTWCWAAPTASTG